RSYSNEVTPDRRTLRTVFRDTLRSRAISLIVLPLRKCSRRIRPIVSTVSIPPTTCFESKQAAHQAQREGVNFGRRSPSSGGQNCTPNNSQPPRWLFDRLRKSFPLEWQAQRKLSQAVNCRLA